MPGYTPQQADKIGKIIDGALSHTKITLRRVSAGALAAMLGDALDRWPDDFGPGERDEVSHIIDVLDRIDSRSARHRA